MVPTRDGGEIEMERRDFLKASMATAAGTALAAGGIAGAQPAGPAAQPAGPAPAAARTPADRFFSSDDFNYPVLTLIGGAYYHTADIGRVLAIVDRIEEGNYESAYRAFTEAGTELASLAEDADRRGRRVTAHQAFMQASAYWYSAIYFGDGTDQPDAVATAWRRSRALWDKAAPLFRPAVEPMRIPFEGTTLPAFFFRGAEPGRRRPLVVLNNGSDGSVLDMWNWGGAGATERGYHALTFDGPGQGAALFEQGLYFRPNWETVLGPVLAFARTLPDVDPDRIAVQGISQGGYWVPRALAFLPTITAGIADPGVVDVFASWTANLPPELLNLLNAGQKQAFDDALAEGMKESVAARQALIFRSRPYGLPSLYDTFKAAQQYDNTAVVPNIRCPMLITDPDQEQFFPGQPRKLYDLITAPKTLVRFTTAEGADWHCEPKSLGFRDMKVFDWLDMIF
jgi:dienelactone hydrolase